MYPFLGSVSHQSKTSPPKVCTSNFSSKGTSSSSVRTEVSNDDAPDADNFSSDFCSFGGAAEDADAASVLALLKARIK